MRSRTSKNFEHRARTAAAVAAESGSWGAAKTRLDLGGVAADLVDQVPDPGRQKAVNLTATLEPGWMANADRTQVERMISNLLSNALKYTPTGGQGTRERVWGS